MTDINIDGLITWLSQWFYKKEEVYTKEEIDVLLGDYTISFSQSSYAAIGGNVTLEVLLLKGAVEQVGKTITISDGTNSYAAITDNNGIASLTLTNLSSGGTYTASFLSISDSCTVTVSTYLLNDDASVDNSSSLFGSSINLRNGGANTTGWNNSGYYTITTSGSNKESMRVLSALTGITDDFVLEYDSYTEQTDGTSGFVIYNSSTAWEKLTDNVDSAKRKWYGYNDGSFHETAYDEGTETTYQKWVHYTYTLQGTSFKMEISINGSLVWSHTETIHFNRDNTTQYGLNSEWASGRTTRYKNIQAYTI